MWDGEMSQIKDALIQSVLQLKKYSDSTLPTLQQEVY